MKTLNLDVISFSRCAKSWNGYKRRFYFICSTWGSWRVKSSCTEKRATAGIKLYLIATAWSFPWLIEAILKMLFKCLIWQTKPFHCGLPRGGGGFVACVLVSLSPVSLGKMSLSHFHVIASQTIPLFFLSLLVGCQCFKKKIVALFWGHVVCRQNPLEGLFTTPHETKVWEKNVTTNFFSRAWCLNSSTTFLNNVTVNKPCSLSSYTSL